MRVALSVDALNPQLSGIGRYTWELCKGLSRRDEIASLRFFGHRRLIEAPGLLLEGQALPRRPRVVRPFDTWRFERVLRKSIVHGPNYFLPPTVGRGIVTVHDLSVFRFPETHPAARVRAFEQMFQSSISRADHIITDTEVIRLELIETFGIDPESITAVHLGIDERFEPKSGEQLAEAVGEFGLSPGGYGLCVSTLEPRKKIPELLSAWACLPGALKNRFPLVLAGGAGWKNDAIHAAIETAAAQGWVRHIGYVEDDALPALYAGAALFIYPSTYEGFGLPPIEAMACGVPVIVARKSCLPEVCGPAARYVDPDDIDEFARTVAESLMDREWRDVASREGVLHASRYSWARCLDQTLSVYRKLLTGDS